MKNKVKLFGALALTAVSLGTVGIVNYSTQSQHHETDLNFVNAASSDYGTYYNRINPNASPQALFDSLHDLISKRSSCGYDGLYRVYQDSDSRPDGKVNDYYSNITNYRHFTDKAGSYKVEGDCYNREHSIPQSWWGKGESNQGCDPFIVVPTDGKVNGMRSSYPFGEVDRNNISYRSANDYSLLGSSSFPGYNGKVFEPNDQWKGDFARNYFYAVTCWSSAPNWTSNAGASCFSSSGTFGLTKYAVNLFTKWHKQDPVDAYEMNRNNAIQRHCHNRNPFIDFPEYVNVLWGDGEYVPAEPTLTIKDVIRVEVGNTASVGAKINGGTGTIAYFSNDTSVATVDSNGLVKGIKAGEAVITASATVNGKTLSATCKVKVTNPGEVTYQSISEIRGLNDNDKVDAVGYVLGTRNVSSQNFSNLYVADAAGGACVSIKSNKVGTFDTYQIGEKVRVIGKRGNDYGAPTVNVTNFSTDIKKLGGNTIPQPAFYDKVPEDFQSILGDYIVINNLKYKLLEGADYCFLDKDAGELYVHTYPDDKFASNFNSNPKFKTDNIALTGLANYFSKKNQNQIKSIDDITKIELAKTGLDAYANKFLSTITCDGKGNVTANSNAWNEMKTAYLALSSEDQATLTAATTADPVVGAAVERYDYIVAKYGAAYENFMNRTVAVNSNVVSQDNTTMIVLISVSTLVAILSVTAIVVISKKKKATR